MVWKNEICPINRVLSIAMVFPSTYAVSLSIQYVILLVFLTLSLISSQIGKEIYT
jgi:hypothetical protein